jgi:hypothetical protein
MGYILLLIGFSLAVLGTLFKGVKQDEQGNTVHSKRGIPIPSNAGKVILIFLALSFATSVFFTYKTAKDNKEKERKATDLQQSLIQKNEELSKQQKSLIQKNEELSKQLGDAQNENISQFKNVLKQQIEAHEESLSDLERKHKVNLNKFSSLLSLQERVGRETVKGFENVLHPIANLKITLALNTSRRAVQPGGMPKGGPWTVDIYIAKANSDSQRVNLAQANYHLKGYISGPMFAVIPPGHSESYDRMEIIATIEAEQIDSTSRSKLNFLDLGGCDYYVLIGWEPPLSLLDFFFNRDKEANDGDKKDLQANSFDLRLRSLTLSSPSQTPVKIDRFKVRPEGGFAHAEFDSHGQERKLARPVPK